MKPINKSNKSKGIYIISCILFLLIVVMDQITKKIAVSHLAPNKSVTLIEDILSLTYVENRGAAFGMLQDSRWFFVIFTSIVFVIAGYCFFKLERTKHFYRLCPIAAVVAAGAFGNYIDRFLNGFVVDFIHVTFIDFPKFNIADSAISVGAVLLFIYVTFFMDEKKSAKELSVKVE